MTQRKSEGLTSIVEKSSERKEIKKIQKEIQKADNLETANLSLGKLMESLMYFQSSKVGIYFIKGFSSEGLRKEYDTLIGSFNRASRRIYHELNTRERHYKK